MVTRHETARDVPVVGESDVLVCGGGPAGVAAAVASARAGARTRLIETNGCLGGILTSGLLTWLLDYRDKPGIMAEVVSRLEARGALRASAYDTEQLKLLFEQMCAESGVALRLHTCVVAAGVTDGRITHATTESKSGREAWLARVFVDCTGDGDLAAQAGCGFEVGRPTDGGCQPASLICMLGGVSASELIRLGFVRSGHAPGDTKKRLLEEMGRAGVTPSYGGPTMFAIREDLVCMMSNHQYGVSATDAQDLTDATVAARQELNRLVDALRSLGGVWADVHIISTAETIGVREGRRIHGVYTVTADDLRSGARHPDAVCRVNFGTDVHAVDPRTGTKADKVSFTSQPYDVPLRALISKDVDGLMMAGRCISGDFLAHSSYRVVGNAVAMGEAAGLVAATASESGISPQQVEWQQAIRRREAGG